MSATLRAIYRNGPYLVRLFNDGTKIREELPASMRPVNDRQKHQEVLPEHMDLKITDWCDANCAHCHESSTTRGQHADLGRITDILTRYRAGTEVAIGGGDPLSHPNFASFVRELHAAGLVPSVTVNGRHIDRHRDLLYRLKSESALNGIGISKSPDLSLTDNLVRATGSVLHVIAGIDDVGEFLADDVPTLHLLILGYKTWGRGSKLRAVKSASVDKSIAAWFDNLEQLKKKHALSFDSLAIEQLKPRRLFSSDAEYQERYMGDEGTFGFYIDAVTSQFALSSYSSSRFPFENSIEEMFRKLPRY